jgi:predicted metalloprotease with PDZ domain
VDARVRVASGGARSLDDLVAAMLLRRRSGQSYDESAWRDLLAAELGAGGIAAFESMLAGETIVPPADAFEPGFVRTAEQAAQFELGFPVASLHGLPATVTGLAPGSPAALAGLREGDEIVGGDHPERAREALAGLFTVEVRRAGATVPITFSTQGARITRYRWRAASGRST